MIHKPLYKYRSLENFEFFVDILLNERLYACSYEKMNDAMEGVYYNYGLSRNILKEIKEGKENLNICSLSYAADNPLLWAHYANGSRGVNIEVEVTGHGIDTREIQYDGTPVIKECLNTAKVAKEILTHKHDSWSYEEEVRVFTIKSYVKVRITRIILGEKISKRHKKLIKKLVQKLYPEGNVKVVEYMDFLRNN